MEPGPFHPIVYWPHVVFGISSVALALIAIVAAKGSRLHRRSGQLFAAFMGIAAITAILFSVVRLAPPALFSAFSVLYGIGMGILSLRVRNGGWKILQSILPVIPLAMALLGIAALASLYLSPEPMPLAFKLVMTVIVGAVIVFFAWLFVGDVRFLRETAPDRIRRFKRHALRMAVAAAETVRAPLISFGPSLGPDGALSFPVYFFGPFLLIPMIYFLAMPGWVKKGEAMRASKASTATA